MDTLEKMGFPSKWRRWMQFCLTIVRYSVLINGESLEFLELQRAAPRGSIISCLIYFGDGDT